MERTMIRNLQNFSVWQRRLIFFSIFGGILLVLVAVTLLLVNQTLNNGARVTAVALDAQTTVHQFAALPDDDAYPAAVAVRRRERSTRAASRPARSGGFRPVARSTKCRERAMASAR